MAEHQLRFWSAEEQLLPPLLIAISLLSAAFISAGWLFWSAQVALLAVPLFASLATSHSLFETAWAARLDARFEPVAEPWLERRAAFRQAVSRRLGVVRRLAQVSVALFAGVMLATIAASIAGAHVSGAYATAFGLAVYVPTVSVSVSIPCYWVMRFLVKDWQRSAATPLRLGPIIYAADYAGRIQTERAVLARHVLLVAASSATALVLIIG